MKIPSNYILQKQDMRSYLHLVKYVIIIFYSYNWMHWELIKINLKKWFLTFKYVHKFYCNLCFFSVSLSFSVHFSHPLLSSGLILDPEIFHL